MAACTKIIDLFGIPACGKTTIINSLENQNKTGLRIKEFNVAICNLRHEPLKLLRSISIKCLYRSIALRFAVPFDKKRKDLKFKEWLLHSIYYNYIKKFTDCDVVFVDHGDIQHFVSIERGENLHLKKSYLNACINYLAISKADIYVYCDVSVGTAMFRMQKRGRNSGRIDIIREKSKQYEELEKEKKRFDYYFRLLQKQNKRVHKLNMEKDPSILARHLLYSLVNIDKKLEV